MSSQPYDFDNTNRQWDASERGVTGTSATGPIVLMRMGTNLFRALYELRNTTTALGSLGGGMPNAQLDPIGATTITLDHGATASPAYADTTPPATYDHLSVDLDGKFCSVTVTDAAYVTGDVACPTIQAWCAALGGTYQKV